MSLKKYAVFLTFLLFSFTSFSQQEEASLFPLTEILQIIEKHYGYTFAYADDDIKSIKVPEPPNLLSFTETISFLEKKTDLKFTVIGDKQVAVSKEISYNDPFEELEEIVITNIIAPGISKKNDGSLVIDYDEFEIMPGLIEPDVFQTIQALPGIESVNETVSNINIRGGTNDQNLILWDGIRVYQTGHFFGLISAINPLQNSKAEIYKNGTPAHFGNSVSGVINLTSPKELSDKFSGSVGTTFLSADVFLDTALDKKSSIQVAGRTSINNVFITPTYYQYYERAFQDTEIEGNFSNGNEDFRFSDLSFRWLYKFSENDLLRLNYFYISNELGYSASQLSNAQLQTKKSSLSQNNLGMGAFYQKNWSNSFTSKLQLYHTNYNLTATNSFIEEGNRIEQENKLYENNLKITTAWKINSQFQLNNGYELVSTRIEDALAENEITDEDVETETLNLNSFFTTLKYQSPDKRSIFQLGNRLNLYSGLDIFLSEPRLSINHRFLENFTVELLGEMKSQHLSQLIDFQNEFLRIENRRWQLANQDDLPLTKSQQVSTGISYQKNKWLINAETYYKKVEGISSQSQGFQNQLEFAQLIGEYQTWGVDFLVNKQFEDFSARLSYSFTDNNYDFPEFTEGNIPNSFEIDHSFKFATTYTRNDFKISSGFVWRSGKPFTPISTEGLANNQFDYETVNSSNLANYFRVDISASQEFQIQEKLLAYAGISIWNLLDRQNIINAFYRENASGEIQLLEQKALGLTPNFVFRVKF